ncbi:MAG: penicillin acylase family protein [Pseudomonadota bacterium]
MRTVFKALLWLLGGASCVAAIALALVYYLMSRSVADYEADYAVEGLTAEVEIVRDANAVPHIYAANDLDAYYALGLAHAQDRLWQMEIGRRGAQGRLAELFGASAVDIDRRLRTFDLYTYAKGAAARQSPETTTILEAYAAGVNAWIRVVNAEALGRGAPEFFLFNEGLAPWTPADSIAILKVMALRLTDSARREVDRALLLREIGPEKLRDVDPDYPDAGLLALPSFTEAFRGLSVPGPQRRAALDPWEEAFLPRAGFGGASNAWAVDGGRTTTGAPLLANDPHLWLSAPSIWMLAHIEFPDQGVIGGTIAGVPAVLVGRNRDLAWGLTNVGMDDQDLYIEKLNPENPNQYLTPDGWADFTERTELIQVNGGDPVEITLRWTRHGPVLPENVYEAGAVTPEGHVAALAWTTLSSEDRTIDGLIRLKRATTIEEAQAAGDLVLAPGQNVTVADKDGVGVFVTGRPPQRSPESRSEGRIPSLGWIAENDWDGLAPLETLPKSIRPFSGIVANANNRSTNAPFPNHISFDWAAPYRIQRVERKLNDREFHTLESFIEIQNDTVSEMARSVLPLIARELWWTRDEGVGDIRGDRREAALALLGEWNGEMSEHAPEPLIFTAWMRALTNRLAEDELGEAIAIIEGPNPLFVERVFRDIDGAGVWCDVDKSVRVESCEEIAKLALDDALEELVAVYGDGLSTWRWGEAHRARHVATPLGRQWPLSLLVNIEHETSGGDYTLQRAKTAGRGPEPYLNVHAAGYRAVYDFSDLDRSVFIITTGQSGHLLSRHYDDLADKWRGGEYISMSMREEDIRAGAVGVTRLSSNP